MWRLFKTLWTEKRLLCQFLLLLLLLTPCIIVSSVLCRRTFQHKIATEKLSEVIPFDIGKEELLAKGKNTRHFNIPGKWNSNYNKDHPHIPDDGEYDLPVYPDDAVIKKMYESPVARTRSMILAPNLEQIEQSETLFRLHNKYEREKLDRILNQSAHLKEPLYPIENGTRALLMTVSRKLAPTAFTALEVILTKFNFTYPIGLFHSTFFFFTVAFNL